MAQCAAKPRLSKQIMSGDAGAWAAPVRGLLSFGELAYTGLIRARNKYYDSARRVRSVSVPVISVGNITVGGTGKTPLVMELLQRLEREGRSPAVIARGYGSTDDEPGDEELLIRKRCPGAAYVADPDRHRGATEAVRRMGADVIVLDDGFQHRRLKRDLDIVLIDAMCPFGYDHLLPRGLLREPLSGLRRANLLAITRSDQVGRSELERIEATIRQHNPSAPVIRLRTRVVGVETLSGRSVDLGKGGGRVVAMAAIGRPEAFATTLSAMGLAVVATRWWPDHHRYRSAEIESLLKDRNVPAHDRVLTTEKDAVKLAVLKDLDPESIGVVRIGLEFESEGDAILGAMIRSVLASPQKIAP